MNTRTHQTYLPKEISWLSFNERVLQEADNINVPLVERLKFLGIYSSNLDEFFRVRVATLKRISQLGKKAINIIGEDPKVILNTIHDIVLEQRNSFQSIYQKLLLDLAKEHIYFVNENQLDESQAIFVNNYFKHNVRQKLMPVMLDQVYPAYKLKDDTIYLAIWLNKPDGDKYSLIEIPTKVFPRFLKLPSQKNSQYFIFLDDIVRFGLIDLFGCNSETVIEAYTIKLTLDAELDIHDDISESYIRNVSKSLKRRKEGNPVRLVIDEKIPDYFLNLIIKKLKIGKEDVTIPGGRYHNFKDFISFPINDAKYHYEPTLQTELLQFIKSSDLFKEITRKDILLYFPYHNFENFIDFLRTASIDSKVKEIKITLYRLAKKSIVVDVLLNALRNGKSITVVLELQARFDEEANISWATQLREEGAKVIYGANEVKVHSKICLITKIENKKLVKYACIGTGNFNEDTAKIYTDALLITKDRKITNDVFKIFDFLNVNYKISPFNHLLVSPFNMRTKIKAFIIKEIKNAKEGKIAKIYLKINNLSDAEIIQLLYDANKAGVDVKLNIRGMFSLVTEIPKLSDKILARGIIDRYLEHTRIYIFHNNGDEKIFISSADLLTRNLDRRVEVTCPIYDKSIKTILKDVFSIHWKDNVKARLLDKNLSNNFFVDKNPPFRAQIELGKYFNNLKQS
ncbi:MAG: polyphosphate kinase 1 [Bacteroidetes bacterium GWA2_30_7]|nr:MAG: polyphosphate kinase 1 [Bacteroidetes bacterium GWA2_30_7]